MRRAHSVTDGTPDSVEVDLEAMPRRVARSLERQLAEGERIVIRTRQHPAVLVRQALWPLAAFVVYVWFDAGLHVAEPLLRLTGIVLLVGLARLGWAELQRRYRWIVVTNKRILRHEGVLDVSVPMMRLTKVTDMTYRRPLVGELLGFGTIIIESAGQEQGLRELTFIPEPDHVNAALNSEIFGEKPRERRSGTGRSWPKLPRRPRRGGDGPEGPDGPDDGGGGPPRGRGPRDPGPILPGGGVSVTDPGYPAMPEGLSGGSPESWYRSSNLAPRLLGDTGEIPVVRTGSRADDVPFDQDSPAPRADDGTRDDHVRAIPLYPPRDWVDERP
ncbi:PH domain-containing protein [Arthrobacter sp. NEB 688]|uniref:PH domain-containing protein n=1 Tax=Arthrobacter sp. NEB 688 TaxID=904039 RepID=UPI0015664035|nr:PH domain-containing protein [Arthrobacter sp. NEB 688]QKE83534.1 PH domain-containing protein [Arthrobacter sp. NEB 688]